MTNMMDHRKLLGRRVLTQDGTEIGEIEAFHVDTDTWMIRAAEVRLERKFLDDLRLKKPLIGSQSVKLGLDLVSGVSDAMVLRLTLQGLADHLTPKGPEVPAETAPAEAPPEAPAEAEAPPALPAGAVPEIVVEELPIVDVDPNEP